MMQGVNRIDPAEFYKIAGSAEEQGQYLQAKRGEDPLFRRGKILLKHSALQAMR
jgi:hypothetical protein